jgi:hypothetical protein
MPPECVHVEVKCVGLGIMLWLGPRMPSSVAILVWLGAKDQSGGDTFYAF